MDSPKTPKSTSLSAELKELIDKRNILTTRTRMKVLNDLDELQRQEMSKKEENLRSKTIQEILSSEVKYMKQLEIIKEFFMKPVLEKKLLSQASYTTLFENIETLYNVNGELLNELEQNPENVANAFCKLAPFFKLYSVYAYNYKRALFLLQEIQRNDPVTSEFISNQETRPEVSHKLSSLLIAPIQRVPRYKLLLQELIRHTAPRQKDYNDLQASLVEIEKVASHINSLVAEYEDTQKLLELQKHIVNFKTLIKPGRKLIRQGPLMRVSRKGNSSFRRHFVLLSDTLLYCKGDPENSLTVCCMLPLNKCKVERVLSNGLFKVICLHEILLLYSENGDSEAWIAALNDAVKKYIECRQTLRKDSSSRMPIRKIIRFDKDEVVEKRGIRKRPLSINDISEESNNSNIVYINKDTETDASSDNSPFFSALKRFRRKSAEVETPIRVRSWLDESKRNSTYSLAFGDKSFSNQNKCTSPKNLWEFEKNDSSVNAKNIFERKNNENTIERLLVFKGVSRFFSTLGNSLKGFFNRN